MHESIYNLVPVEKHVPVKPPMYRSPSSMKDQDVAGSTFGMQNLLLIDIIIYIHNT